MTYFQAELNKALEAIERVRELHRPGREKDWEITGPGDQVCYETVIVCYWCQYLIDNDYYSERVAPYPCPTIQALDGEQK